MEQAASSTVAQAEPAAALLPTVTARDAPLPSMRSLDDALVLLAEIERSAIDSFANAGLPTVRGLYRRSQAGDGWIRLADDLPAEARWREVLERPPEAGFRYLSLADVGRTERPDSPDIQAAASTLDRAGDLRRLLGQGAADGEEDPTLMMFWSTVELMAVLFSGRKDEARAGARRAVVWDTWRAEARRIWIAEPGLSLRAVAKLVVARLALSESSHTVRRRLAGNQPPLDAQTE